MASYIFTIGDVAMMDHEKIVFDQLPSSHGNGVLFENLNGTADSDKEILGRSEESGTAYVSPIEVLEISENPERRNHLTVSKESGDKGFDQMDNSMTQAGHTEVESGKPSSSECVVATLNKQKEDCKPADGTVASVNGSVVTTSHSKKPSAVATNRRSSDEKQAVENTGSTDSSRQTKSSALSTTWHSQQSGKSVLGSFNLNFSHSDSLKGHPNNLKPLKQGLPNKNG